MSSPEDGWRPAPEASGVVESAPRQWPAPRRPLSIVAAATAALLVGLAAGYAVGTRLEFGRGAPAHSRSPAARLAPAAASACPAAPPVQFAVTLGSGEHAAGGPRLLVARLPGFVDLGGVPYAGCPAG